jgi:hypothetical protein
MPVRFRIVDDHEKGHWKEIALTVIARRDVDLGFQAFGRSRGRARPMIAIGRFEVIFTTQSQLWRPKAHQ